MSVGLPRRVTVVEVGPRDGLQNEAAALTIDDRVDFCNRLIDAGLPVVEVGAFVSPKWVPQMSGSDEVYRRTHSRPGVRRPVLVPNRKGFEAARAAGAREIAVFTAASETFSRKNTNASIAESLERFKPAVARSPVPVRGYISTAFHCPFEGPVAPETVLAVAHQLLDLGCAELSIGDTIGKATPDEVKRLLELVLPAVRPSGILALHLHDTFGQAVDNALTAETMGVRVFDASAGGIGGCPYAPGAPGNVATEALVAAFPNRTGIDAAPLRKASAIVRPFMTSHPDSPLRSE